jgi:hypothetical protein
MLGLVVVIVLGSFTTHADDLFDYDRENVFQRISERYGPQTGAEIESDLTDYDTSFSGEVWLSGGKFMCGFFIEDSGWGVFGPDNGQVILGFDRAAKKAKPRLGLLKCYRRARQ